MTKKQILIVISGLFIFAIFLCAENHFSHSFQACLSDERFHQSSNNADKEPLIIGRTVESQIVCSIHFVDAHNGFITALAGLAVALFTYTLKQSTDRLWRAGQDSLETTARAFVFISDFEKEVTPYSAGKNNPPLTKGDPNLHITRFAAQPIWKNSGNTPTKNMRICVDWSLGNTEKVGSYRQPAKLFFIAPESETRSEFIEMPGLNALIQDGQAEIHGEVPLMLVWGRADYEDIFGKPHFIEWCYRVRPERHLGDTLRVSFIQWGDYNRTEGT